MKYSLVYCQVKGSLSDCVHCQIISYDGKYNANIKYKHYIIVTFGDTCMIPREIK